MKLLIDTKKKTIEVYGSILEESGDLLTHLLTNSIGKDYKLIRAPQNLLGSVPKIEYNSDSTDKPILENHEQT